MTIKMLQANRVFILKGAVIDVSDDEAKRLMMLGYAEEVKPKREPAKKEDKVKE